ncbi:MAG: OmpA family protein [bacterium]
MKKFFLSIILLSFCLLLDLSAQQSFVVAVVTQNTHYKFQRWKTSQDFPEEYIRDYQKQGFYISGLQNYNNFWSLVLSKTSVISEQVYQKSEVFPDKFIKDYIAQGFSITAMSYGSKEWIAVLSKIQNTKPETQYYFYGLRYPKEEIKKANEEGYYISKLQYSNDYWIVIFTKDKDDDNKKSAIMQEIITVKSFDDDNLKFYLNEGWHISDLTYKDGILILLSKNLDWGRQDSKIIFYSKMSEAISNWWNYKYAITNLVTIYDIVLNISSADNSDFLKNSYSLTKKPESCEDNRFVDYIEKNQGTESAFRAVQKLAGTFIQEKEWEKGIEVYEKYRIKFPDFSDRIDKIIELLKAKEEGVIIENLGTAINSVFNDYFPIINLEGNKLYFCSFSRDDSFGGEDIYVSESKNGIWQSATNIGNQINSGSHEATLGISADNLELTVFGNYPESLGNGDVFYYSKTEDGWSKRKHYPEPINSMYFDSDLCFSSDGNAIFFVSDRPSNGNYCEKDNFSKGIWGGNLDIYVVFKTDSGWSDAINLGNTINTPYIDRSPYLHPDGKTLYFSSSGHYGIGGLDVFKSTRLNPDSWTEWSEPVNLGKEINTTENDWGYKVSLDGKFAYFAAFNLQDTAMKQDIYKVTLPKKARPDLVATIKGKVVDPEGNPLSAKIKWENLSKGVTVGELSSDPVDGSFFIALPLGKKYGYYAEKEGYYPVSKNIDLTKNIDSMLTMKEDIVLIPIKQIKEKNLTIRINNLFFDFNSSELLPESYPELNRLIKVLDEFHNFKIEISGHTDDVGSTSYNKKLSIDRAKAVLDFLVSKGINKKLLIPKGYGKSKPLSTNQTEEGRAMNRRVEIRLIQK